MPRKSGQNAEWEYAITLVPERELRRIAASKNWPARGVPWDVLGPMMVERYVLRAIPERVLPDSQESSQGDMDGAANTKSPRPEGRPTVIVTDEEIDLARQLAAIKRNDDAVYAVLTDQIRKYSALGLAKQHGVPTLVDRKRRKKKDAD